jgi:broad specificity phosphatase PhoE
MTKIILTRHGHVDWIAPERFRGRADLRLTDLGLAQARATSLCIKSSWAVAAIYTSPMSRCVRTAEIIAQPFGLEPQAMEALNDIDYGEWQGLTPDAVRARWPQEFELWYRRPDLARIPGGELLSDVLSRAARALRVVLDRHPEDTVVLVGHDSINRVILLHALELPLSRYWRLGQLPCAINEIDAAADGFYVRAMNQAWHLHGL